MDKPAGVWHTETLKMTVPPTHRHQMGNQDFNLTSQQATGSDGSATAVEQLETVLSSTVSNENFNVDQLFDSVITLLEKETTMRCLLTSSGSHSLELAARSMDLQPGDQVIVPSYSFPTTASSFLWNGAQVVLVDVRADTQNIDLEAVKAALTTKTRAVCIVHYAGVGASPDDFAAFCSENDLWLVEDNAHGLGGTYLGAPLGSFGDMSCLSFHRTKNISCGEGGAFLTSRRNVLERAEVLQEKGTNRSRFVRGEIAKYEWIANGSSWLMSEYQALILRSRLQSLSQVTQFRKSLWDHYMNSLGGWAKDHGVKLPHIPDGASHPGHLFYLIFPDTRERDYFRKFMQNEGILTPFHYQDLASSPYVRDSGIAVNSCPNSLRASSCLVRLPLHNTMRKEEQNRIVEAIFRWQGA